MIESYTRGLGFHSKHRWGSAETLGSDDGSLQLSPTGFGAAPLAPPLLATPLLMVNLIQIPCVRRIRARMKGLVMVASAASLVSARQDSLETDAKTSTNVPWIPVRMEGHAVSETMPTSALALPPSLVTSVKCRSQSLANVSLGNKFSHN